VSEALTATAIELLSSRGEGSAVGRILAVGAAVPKGLEPLFSLMYSGGLELALADPRNSVYNEKDKSRSPALYVAGLCDGERTPINGALHVDVILYLDCVYTDDCERIRRMIQAGMLQVGAAAGGGWMLFGWSGEVAARGAIAAVKRFLGEAAESGFGDLIPYVRTTFADGKRLCRIGLHVCPRDKWVLDDIFSIDLPAPKLAPIYPITNKAFDQGRFVPSSPPYLLAEFFSEGTAAQVGLLYECELTV